MSILLSCATEPSVTFGSIVPNPFDPEIAALSIELTVTTTDTVTSSRVYVRSNESVLATLGPFDDIGTFDVSWDGVRDDTTNAPSAVYELLAEIDELRSLARWSMA